jgi:hypothetical protein
MSIKCNCNYISACKITSETLDVSCIAKINKAKINQLSANSINSESINSESINSESINSESINSENVNSTNVISTFVESENVTSENINSTNVTSTNINSTNVTSENINSTNVTSENINSTNVTSTNINSTNVTSENINSTNVTSENINSTNVTSKTSNVNELILCQNNIPSTPGGQCSNLYVDNNTLIQLTSDLIKHEVDTTPINPFHGWWVDIHRGNNGLVPASMSTIGFKIIFIDASKNPIEIIPYSGLTDKPFQSSILKLTCNQLDNITLEISGSKTLTNQITLRLQSDNVTLCGFSLLPDNSNDGDILIFRKLSQNPIIRPLNDIGFNDVNFNSNNDCNSLEFMLNEYIDYVISEQPGSNLRLRCNEYPGYSEIRRLQHNLLNEGVIYTSNILKIQKSNIDNKITTIICETDPHIYVSSLAILTGFTGSLSILNGTHQILNGISSENSNLSESVGYVDNDIHFVNSKSITYSFYINVDTTDIVSDEYGFVLTPGATVTSKIGPLLNATDNYRELINCENDITHSAFRFLTHSRILYYSKPNSNPILGNQIYNTFEELRNNLTSPNTVQIFNNMRTRFNEQGRFYFGDNPNSFHTDQFLVRKNDISIDTPNKARYFALSSTLGQVNKSVSAKIIAADPIGANTPLNNASEINGNIALVSMNSGVASTTRIFNCQNAGAIGVIIFNSIGNMRPFIINVIDPRIIIPSCVIGGSDGNIILNNLPSTGSMNIWYKDIVDENYLDDEIGFEPRNIWWRLVGAPTNDIQRTAGASYYGSTAVGQTFESTTWPALAGTTPGGTGTSRYFQLGNSQLDTYSYDLAKQFLFGRIKPSFVNGRKIGYVRIGNFGWGDFNDYMLNANFAPKPPAFPIDTSINNPRVNFEAAARVWSAGMQYIVTTLQCTDLIIDNRFNGGGSLPYDIVPVSFFGADRNGWDDPFRALVGTGFEATIKFGSFNVYNDAYNKSVVLPGRRILASLSQQYYPGSVLQNNSKVNLITSRNARSSGDAFPHFFLGNALDKNLGNGVIAKIYGDVNGVLAGGPRYDPFPTISNNSYILQNSSGNGVPYARFFLENSYSLQSKMIAEPFNMINRLNNINPSTGLPSIQPDNSITLGLGPWTNTVEHNVYSDTGVVGTTPHGPRLPGDNRHNPGPIFAYPDFPSPSDRLNFRDAWLEEAAANIISS